MAQSSIPFTVGGSARYHAAPSVQRIFVLSAMSKSFPPWRIGLSVGSSVRVGADTCILVPAQLLFRKYVHRAAVRILCNEQTLFGKDWSTV